MGIPYGVLRADDRVVREIEEALRIAKRAGDDLALSFICTVAWHAQLGDIRATDVAATLTAWRWPAAPTPCPLPAVSVRGHARQR